MSEYNVFDFTSYREGSSNLVPCRRCSRPIPAGSTRCPHCGLWYQGHAFEFAPDATGEVRMRFGWIKAVAALILALLAGLFLLALATAVLR
ncbi:MAG: hypothetical protein KJ060_10845 [Candidatus Hydrogenedentes bacterium]|nr:hypothetical protein [Candidatus Hydrogenedentota bacterium]